MTDPLRVEAGELSAEEILDALCGGRRVLVETEMMGETRQLSLRHDGTTFYCDTPTTLHKHSEAEEMRTCIEKMGYAKEA
ncbi:hypothetical protein [Halopelagius fulvigenes]|uniref:DUF8001 domain-containing protein n=1 Tax=Halopelagius fulvigenes TaxID=1198324 RepID=A0ABD5U6I1_9EURY